MIRPKVASDAEIGIISGRGLIPWADMLPQTFNTLRPDSSNGEFTTRQHSCCAYFLDDLSHCLNRASVLAVEAFNKQYDSKAELCISALHKVNKTLYGKFGTPKSTMSGCNPSRHVLNGADYAEPFDGMSYEEVLLKHGSPMGTHLHIDLSNDQIRDVGLAIEPKTYRVQTERFDNKVLAESVKTIITLAMIPTMFIMRNSGDDDAIKQRFKLLPMGYFRVKSYGLEFKDFPSSILLTPWYAAAAMMSLRTAIFLKCRGVHHGFDIDEAYKKVSELDHDYIAQAFNKMVEKGFLRHDSSLSHEAAWKKLSKYKPTTLEEDWEWKKHILADGTYYDKHDLGLESSVWKKSQG